MATTGKATGGAFNARTLVAEMTDEQRAELAAELGAPISVQAQRVRYADEADAAVTAIERKLEGVKASLTAARAEAKRLRAEAAKGGE